MFKHIVSVLCGLVLVSAVAHAAEFGSNKYGATVRAADGALVKTGPTDDQDYFEVGFETPQNGLRCFFSVVSASEAGKEPGGESARTWSYQNRIVPFYKKYTSSQPKMDSSSGSVVTVGGVELTVVYDDLYVRSGLQSLHRSVMFFWGENTKRTGKPFVYGNCQNTYKFVNLQEGEGKALMEAFFAGIDFRPGQ